MSTLTQSTAWQALAAHQRTIAGASIAGMFADDPQRFENFSLAQGGLLLFYNDRLFLGMGHDGKRMTTYRGGKAGYWQEPAPATRTLHLKIANERHIVTFYYSVDGQSWIRHGLRSETSGYNANTIDDLASLRPALFAAGQGTVRFRDFRYRALPG